VAEWLGVDLEQVRLVTGDTDRVAVGGGSSSGRSMRLGAVVMAQASDQIVAHGARVAAWLLEAAEADIEFRHRRFGVKGTDRAVGLFEVASGGTIFLDEIGELPKSMQAKLLRVLESGEIRRVGENSSFEVDVRVVCATHRNLSEMVEHGEFREDLMYRINTFEITLPAVRDRISDIPALADHLFRRFRPGLKADDELFTPEAIDLLKSHNWPGNVRELANVIEHATILCDSPPITPEHLPQRFAARRAGPKLKLVGPMSLRDLEMQAIHDALDRHDGSKPDAAEELGISLKTLYNKLNQAAELKESA